MDVTDRNEMLKIIKSCVGTKFIKKWYVSMSDSSTFNCIGSPLPQFTLLHKCDVHLAIGGGGNM